MKFPLDTGSKASQKFLNSLILQEEVNGDIFLIKLVQKVLDYKYWKVRWIKRIIGLIHALYLFFIMYIPFFGSIEGPDADSLHVIDDT
jgi:hypothetical protein